LKNPLSVPRIVEYRETRNHKDHIIDGLAGPPRWLLYGHGGGCTFMPKQMSNIAALINDGPG
jgi:hypothetical protein